MRTRATNVLQVVIILTGLTYIIIGALFLFSPLQFARCFSVAITDEWFEAIQSDTFVAPLYFFARAFAAMVLTSGLAMILPLFDPLKYRGLVYFTGVFFPAIASVLLLYGGYSYDHLIVITVGYSFLSVFAITVASLIFTNKEAKSGIE